MEGLLSTGPTPSSFLWFINLSFNQFFDIYKYKILCLLIFTNLNYWVAWCLQIHVTELDTTAENSNRLQQVWELKICEIVTFIRRVTAIMPSTQVSQPKKSWELESVQKTDLKVNLEYVYVSYDAAIEMIGLKPLHTRRHEHCLAYGFNAVKHPVYRTTFPWKQDESLHNRRERKQSDVNVARTEAYRQSKCHCRGCSTLKRKEGEEAERTGGRYV